MYNVCGSWFPDSLMEGATARIRKRATRGCTWRDMGDFTRQPSFTFSQVPSHSEVSCVILAFLRVIIFAFDSRLVLLFEVFTQSWWWVFEVCRRVSVNIFEFQGPQAKCGLLLNLFLHSGHLRSLLVDKIRDLVRKQCVLCFELVLVQGHLSLVILNNRF